MVLWLDESVFEFLIYHSLMNKLISITRKRHGLRGQLQIRSEISHGHGQGILGKNPRILFRF